MYPISDSWVHLIYRYFLIFKLLITPLLFYFRMTNTLKLRIVLIACLLVVTQCRPARPASIAGLCLNVDALTLKPARPQRRTKIQWRPGSGNIVVKFKIPLRTLCEDMNEVFQEAQENTRRMLFHRRPAKWSDTCVSSNLFVWKISIFMLSQNPKF